MTKILKTATSLYSIVKYADQKVRKQLEKASTFNDKDPVQLENDESDNGADVSLRVSLCFGCFHSNVQSHEEIVHSQ